MSLALLAGLRPEGWTAPTPTGARPLPRPVVVQVTRRDLTRIPTPEVLPTPPSFLEAVPDISNYARRYPREVEARAVFLRTQGFKGAAIARGLGLNAQTVTTWYRRHRVRPPRRGGA